MRSILRLEPTLARGDIPALQERLVALRATKVIIDVSTIVDPDLAVVDALARLQLTARRHGVDLEVHGAGPWLCSLAALTFGSGRQPWRQAEEREDPVDVEEVVDPDDFPA